MVSEMADTLYIITSYSWQCQKLLHPNLRHSRCSADLFMAACKGDLPAQLNMAAVLLRLSRIELAIDIIEGGSDDMVSEYAATLLDAAAVLADAVQVC